jgi:hypothetical protein
MGRGSGRAEMLRVFIGRWICLHALWSLRTRNTRETTKSRVFDVDVKTGMSIYCASCLSPYRNIERLADYRG